MIKRWHLRNFKSFHSPPPLELSQINVLAGANSSGKSSIIQSILLLKQTLQYGSENRPIAINGPLLRLGSFEDLRSFEAIGESLNIGFDVEFDDGDLKGPRPAPWMRNVRRLSIGSEFGTVRTLSLHLSYTGENETAELALKQSTGPSKLTVDLNESTIRLSRATSNEVIKDTYAIYTKRKSDWPDDEENFGPSHQYQVDLDEESEREISTGKPEAQIRGGFVSYFLPSWAIVRYNFAAQKVLKLVDDIFNPSESILGAPNLTDEEVSEAVVSLVNVWLQNHSAQPISLDGGPHPAKTVRDRLTPFLRRNFLTLGISLAEKYSPSEKAVAEITELRQQILHTMLDECKPESDLELEIPRGVGAAVEFIRDFFKQGIRYLGPLRDSPRPVYQVEALESTTDVGYRGEHTAAVLDLNSEKRIFYRRPPNEILGQDYEITSKPVTASLHDAVVEWLVYLGVADDVVTTDAGVFGNRLQVSTDGLGRLHDLTNVGVGVEPGTTYRSDGIARSKGELSDF